MIDWGAIVAQSPSIALALVFAWFAITLIKGQREYSSKVMEEWAARFKTRDQDWMSFLREQRQQQNESTARLAEEIKEIGKQVSATNALLTSHDSKVMSEITRPREKS